MPAPSSPRSRAIMPTAATRPRPRSSAASWPSGQSRRVLTRFASTAEATNIMAGSRPWPTPLARRVCNSSPSQAEARTRRTPAVSSDSRERGEWSESVVAIRRCAAVVKGGRRFSFNALVVVGNSRGQVAWGYGKANEVPPAVEKGVKDAHKQMKRVQLKGGTVPHAVIGKFGAARVLLMPAVPGTGVIAGGAVRAVVEAAGIKDVLTKSFGSNNKLNLVKAAIEALTQLRTKEEIARLRGVAL